MPEQIQRLNKVGFEVPINRPTERSRKGGDLAAYLTCLVDLGELNSPLFATKRAVEGCPLRRPSDSQEAEDFGLRLRWL